MLLEDRLTVLFKNRVLNFEKTIESHTVVRKNTQSFCVFFYCSLPCSMVTSCKSEVQDQHNWGFPGGTGGKGIYLPLQGRQETRFDPWVGKIPWRRKWQPTPVFLPGKSMEIHRCRSLAGYSPWDCKESDTAEHTRTFSQLGC